MPLYLYQVVGSQEVLEIVHGMHEQHTQDAKGRPLKRILTAPNLGIKHTEGTERKRLSNDNIERLGFTKYSKDPLTGKYHKDAGKGPCELNPKTACHECL